MRLGLKDEHVSRASLFGTESAVARLADQPPGARGALQLTPRNLEFIGAQRTHIWATSRRNGRYSVNGKCKNFSSIFHSRNHRPIAGRRRNRRRWNAHVMAWSLDHSQSVLP